MKIIFLLMTLMFASSVTFAQKKAKPVPSSGEMIISNFIFSWRTSTEEGLASVQITCPDKKYLTEINLELNKPASFDFKCKEGYFTKGSLTLADKLLSGLHYGLFLDSYFGDNLGSAFDTHFEGMIATWQYSPDPSEPPKPPTAPSTEKINSWGVKFDQKRTDEFRQEFK